jgi:hypothetical protein
VPVGAAILGGGALSAGASIWGANTAAKAQTSAANNAINAQTSMFDQAKSLAQPFVDFGTSQLPSLNNLLTPGANANATLEQTPGYEFANQQGQKAITNQASAVGGSGNALRGGAQFSEGLAQNTYNSVVQNLLQAAGMGQSAAAGVGNQAVQTGSGIAGNLVGAGNAQAGAATATGNAIGGLGGSVSNIALLNQLTGGKLIGGGSTAAGAWAGNGNVNPSASFLDPNTPFNPAGG